MQTKEIIVPVLKSDENINEIILLITCCIDYYQSKAVYYQGICYVLDFYHQKTLSNKINYLYVVSLLQKYKHENNIKTALFFELDESGIKKRIEILKNWKAQLLCLNDKIQ